MADRRAHREQLQPDRPESHAGLLPQLSTALGAPSASGLVRRRTSLPGPGPVPWSWTGPLVRDRSAATASADRRNPGRPGDPQRLNAVRQPGGAERGTFRAHRHPVDGPVRLARDAGAATASPGGRCGQMRAAGELRACARRGHGYAGLPPGGHRDAAPPADVRGAAVTGRRPGPPVRSRRQAVTWPGNPAARD